MSEEKKLIIGSQFSDKGLQDAEKALKRLEKEGLKIGKILKDFDLTTGAGRGRFAKSIVMAEKQMGKLKGTTQDTAKVMENVYGRQLDKESKRLDQVSRQLERLNKLRKESQERYKREMEIRPDSALAKSWGQRTERLDNLIVNREGERRVRQANLDELKSGQSKQDTERTLMALTIAKAITGAIGQGAAMYQGFKNMDWVNNAQIQQFRGNMLNNMRGGSAIYADALQNGRFDPSSQALLPASHIFKQAGGRGASMLQNMMNAGGAVLEGGMSAAIMKGGMSGAGAGSGVGAGAMNGQVIANQAGGLMGAANKLVGAGGQAVFGGADVEEMQSLQTRIEAAVQSAPMRRMIFDTLAQTAKSRLMASRRLGSRHMGAAGLGAGYGLDLGESFSTGIGMAEQFGSTSTMQGGLMREALGMETFGLDRNKMGSMIGTLGMNRGSNQQSRRELEEVFARGIKRGLNPENVQFFEAIGQAVANNAFGAGGKLGAGTAFGQALTSGFSDSTTMRDIQNRIGGVSALDNMGSNGYMQAIAIENAKKSLGGSADVASTLGLSRASWAELMQGSEEMSVLGVGEGARREQMNSRIAAMMGTVVGEGRSGIGKRLKDAAGSSGDWNKVFKDPTLRKQAAALLHQEFQGAPGMEAFGSFESSESILNFLGGVNDTPQAGGRLSRKMGDRNAFRQSQVGAQNEMKIFGKERDLGPQVGAALDFMGKSFEKLADMPPSLFDNARKTVESLEEVYRVLNKIAEVAPKAAKALEAKETVSRATTGMAAGSSGRWK